MRREQEPDVRETPDSPIGDKVLTHPAFGKIGASRVSAGGQGASLFGSDFQHHHWIALRVQRAELQRGLSYDRTHATERLIEVWLSESQWATFLSSLNMGDGVPCTIAYEGRTMLPGISHRDSGDEYAGEVEAHMADAVEELDRILAETPRMTKKLQDRLRLVRGMISNGVRFVVRSFDEHLEDRVEKAKTEVHAYAQDLALRGGGVLTVPDLQPPELPAPAEDAEPGVGER